MIRVMERDIRIGWCLPRRRQSIRFMAVPLYHAAPCGRHAQRTPACALLPAMMPRHERPDRARGRDRRAADSAQGAGDAVAVLREFLAEERRKSDSLLEANLVW